MTGGVAGANGAVISTSGLDRSEWLRQDEKRSLKWYSVLGCNPRISLLVPSPRYDTQGMATAGVTAATAPGRTACPCARLRPWWGVVECGEVWWSVVRCGGVW